MVDPDNRPRTYFEKHAAAFMIAFVFGSLVLMVVASRACR